MGLLLTSIIAISLFAIPSVSFSQSKCPRHMSHLCSDTISQELNSPNSWDNSSINPWNSPDNWNNSRHNSTANNGVFNNQGKHSGYAVPTQDGRGTNIYNNKGRRTGYSGNW